MAILLGALWIILVPCLMVFSAPYLFDYYFSASGIQFVLFRRKRVYLIQVSEIENVEIVNTLSFTAQFKYFAAFAIGNRFTKKALVVKLKSGRTLVLTPKNPEQALAELTSPKISQ